MKRKKRVAIAAATSAVAGCMAGAVAASCGLDVVDSVKVGGVVSGAVGNLLYQVFRQTPEQQNGESDRVNGPAIRQDTVAPSNETDVQAPAASAVPDPKAVVSEDTTASGPQIPGQRGGEGHDGLQERKNRSEGDSHGAA